MAARRIKQLVFFTSFYIPAGVDEKVRVRMRRHVILAFFMLVCAFQMAVLRMHLHVSPRTPARRSSAAWSLPCLVLTLNVSNIDPSARSCTPFVAPPFTERELDFVSLSALEKILNPVLLESASELSNNASVNIYMNHARIWQYIANRWDVALVLEEDAVVPSNSEEVITQILSSLRRDNVTNFVVKLIDHWHLYGSEWRLVYELPKHKVLTCSCRPSVQGSCSAAYLIDKAAALTLLQHAFPASVHVDVFKHKMGCVEKRIRLYQINPHLVHMNDRPSTHLSNEEQTFRRKYLLVKEVITNLFGSDCQTAAATAARTQ